MFKMRHETSEEEELYGSDRDEEEEAKGNEGEDVEMANEGRTG